MVPGASLPLFQGEDTNGVARGTQVHWQRREMVIFLSHGERTDACAAVRKVLREREAKLHLEDIAVITIVEGEGPVEPGEIPDRHGLLTRQLHEVTGVDTNGGELIVATRFARVVHISNAHERPAEAAVDDALEWLRYGQIACEDCSLPIWD